MPDFLSAPLHLSLIPETLTHPALVSQERGEAIGDGDKGGGRKVP